MKILIIAGIVVGAIMLIGLIFVTSLAITFRNSIDGMD